MLRTSLSGLLGLAFAVVLALSAQAQTEPQRAASPQVAPVQASPAGAVTDISAGGADRNSVRGSGCSGYISNARPVATVDNAAVGMLSIYVTSDSDTTLLVGDPDGRTWYCSDDAEGSNPAVTIDGAAVGKYVVWVGTFTPGAAGATARLHARNGPPAW